MTHFDVFNGDADGICSLVQLRLALPRDAVLVTGVKRDIALLGRVAGRAGDSVTVLDVSVAANRDALDALLARGVAVEYYDHHFAGEPPRHAGLTLHIDTSPRVCTGVIVDRALAGAQRVWAAVAAFGDDLVDVAQDLAASLGLDAPARSELRTLGECLAYNAYGDSEADLIVPPAALYRMLVDCADPFRFMREVPVFREIRETRECDLDAALELRPERTLAAAHIYVLPDAPWSRRVRGAFGNALATAAPDRAHAILTWNGPGAYTVSVRAPRATGTGADALCRKFATGGGRAAAAGINHLPADRLPEFVHQLDCAFR
jgi:hypothetical protein